MYDFYPEWGPARNRDEEDAQPPRRSTRYWHGRAPAKTATAAPESRDADPQRPDDN